jgi:hypothetical protein
MADHYPATHKAMKWAIFAVAEIARSWNAFPAMNSDRGVQREMPISTIKAALYERKNDEFIWSRRLAARGFGRPIRAFAGGERAGIFEQAPCR